MWKAMIAALAAATTGLTGTATAAVPYDVWSCRLPDGGIAPIDGWTQTGPAPGTGIGDGCETGAVPASRALWAVFGSSVAKGVDLAWTFTAPDDVTLDNATLWRAARASTSTGIAQWVVETDESRAAGFRTLENCADYQLQRCRAVGVLQDPEAASNRVELTGMRARRLHTVLRCNGLDPTAPCQHPDGAEFRVYRARLGLIDQAAPELTTPLKGTLLDPGTLHEGERWVEFSASDRGGGIASVGLLVDGHVAVERPAEPGDTRCRTPYIVRVPCPMTATVTVHFDTAALANGSHVVQAFAADVSGNRATSAPFSISTRNAALANGATASRAARLTASVTTVAGTPIRRAVSYGRSAVIRGTLSNLAGIPIAGAQLDVLTRSSRPGAAQRTRVVTTDAMGRFAYRLPTGPSRVVDVAYRAFSLDDGYSATATATLRVRAAIKLTATPRTLRNGQRVRFRGRLVGGPHRQDATILLYALGGRRIPVTSLRADSRGRFSFSYRFRTVAQRSRFRFQVRAERRAGYPYDSGASNVVDVTVRP